MPLLLAVAPLRGDGVKRLALYGVVIVAAGLALAVLVVVWGFGG